MAGTAAIIAAALGALGSIGGAVASSAHGGPPSPLGDKPGGGFSYTPSAAKMSPAGGTPSGQLRLSDIMGAQAPQVPDDEEMTLRKLLSQQGG
jgi:hypothetical protein